jgi:hypothetical protein
MNPQAIMTPGGIADQFTRGLGGVAQAFADRARIDREAKRDAIAQQQAADALARQQEQMIYARGRDAEADRRYAEERRLRMFGIAPDSFQGDPVLGNAATREMEKIALARDQREREIGLKGVPIPATESAPAGSYIPKEYAARAEGFAAHNAQNAFELDKIRAAAEARAQVAPPRSPRYRNWVNKQTGETMTSEEQPGAEWVIATVSNPAQDKRIEEDRMYRDALDKWAQERKAIQGDSTIPLDEWEKRLREHDAKKPMRASSALTGPAGQQTQVGAPNQVTPAVEAYFADLQRRKAAQQGK